MVDWGLGAGVIGALVAKLTGDATLMAVLTGGVHRAPEISRQATPAAFDTYAEIKPCALVKQETTAPFGPHEKSARAFVRIHLYERAGYTSIEAARHRIFSLLDGARVAATSGEEVGVWEIAHVGDVVDATDQALDVPMSVSRFQVVVNRISMVVVTIYELDFSEAENSMYMAVI